MVGVSYCYKGKERAKRDLLTVDLDRFFATIIGDPSLPSLRRRFGGALTGSGTCYQPGKGKDIQVSAIQKPSCQIFEWALHFEYLTHPPRSKEVVERG